jgi:hypothetical protein
MGDSKVIVVNAVTETPERAVTKRDERGYFLPGSSGNPKGSPPNAGLVIRMAINELVQNGFTELRLWRIRNDKDERPARRAAALRVIRMMETGDLADYEDWLNGKKNMKALREAGVHTGLIKKAKIKRDANGGESREIELHDRSGEDFDRVIHETDGKLVAPGQQPDSGVAFTLNIGVKVEQPTIKQIETSKDIDIK